MFILFIFHKDALNGTALGWKNWYFSVILLKYVSLPVITPNANKLSFENP